MVTARIETTAFSQVVHKENKAALPPVAEVAERFANDHIQSGWRKKAFMASLRATGLMRYADKQRNKMLALAEAGENPFDNESIAADFTGIYPQMSFSALLTYSEMNYVHRAAALAHAALCFRAKLLDGDANFLLPRETKTTMARYLNVFGRTCTPYYHNRKWCKDLKHKADSNFIVVSINSHYYKLQVIDENGELYPVTAIAQALEKMITEVAQLKPGLPFGTLTAALDKSHENILLATDPKSDAAIHTLNDALFLLAIDPSNEPADKNQAACNLHVGNYQNRDYRKSLQIIACANGYAGATFGLFGGIEGAMCNSFINWVVTDTHKHHDQIETVCLPFQKINFNQSYTCWSAAYLQKLDDRIAGHRANFPQIIDIAGIGSSEITAHGLSVDATVHAAIHLAWQRQYGKHPFVHNFADMRHLRFGSITRYLTTTPEMKSLALHATRESLKAAVSSHSTKVRSIKKINHAAHYAYFYFLQAPGFKKYLFLVFCALFVPQVKRQLLSPDIWASHIPAFPGVACVSRFGIRFPRLRKNALTFHYSVHDHHITVCITSKTGSAPVYDVAENFQNALKQLLLLS
jgi:hypothetical protein